MNDLTGANNSQFRVPLMYPLSIFGYQTDDFYVSIVASRLSA